MFCQHWMTVNLSSLVSASSNVPTEHRPMWNWGLDYHSCVKAERPNKSLRRRPLHLGDSAGGQWVEVLLPECLVDTQDMWSPNRPRIENWSAQRGVSRKWLILDDGIGVLIFFLFLQVFNTYYIWHHGVGGNTLKILERKHRIQKVAGGRRRTLKTLHCDVRAGTQ